MTEGFLRSIHLFESLKDRELDALMSAGISYRAERGQVLYWESELLNELFLVRSGSVKLVQNSEDGKEFIVQLVAIVAISSFGIAGVGGGATFAALVVLPAMGFPVTIVALLISIEPLIDMARTALNVNGSMVSGVLTGRFLKDIPSGTEVPEPQPAAAD